MRANACIPWCIFDGTDNASNNLREINYYVQNDLLRQLNAILWDTAVASQKEKGQTNYRTIELKLLHLLISWEFSLILYFVDFSALRVNFVFISTEQFTWFHYVNIRLLI